MALIPGSRIGSYEVIAAIGEGGMGEVYKARDPRLNRDVALKILPFAFATDPERLARFRREAQVLASLNHPHIAQIYGFEDTADTHALVMELVTGPTLAELIETGQRETAPAAAAPSESASRGAAARGGGAPRALNIADALSIARQIAEALEAAHEQGITHRDLKPANIKVREDGTVKVLDFGLAKAMDPAGGSSADAMNSPTYTAHPTHLRQGFGEAGTELGVILGTAAYMAPEQARGKPVDKRADIWSFGVVLFEMLTGRRLFDGETVSDTIAKILEREPDWSGVPATTPPKVRELLRRCLEKDLKKRQRDIGDVRIELEEAIAASSPSSSPHMAIAPTTITPVVTRRSPMLVVGGGLLLLVLGAAAGIGLWTSLASPTRSSSTASARLSLAVPSVIRVPSQSANVSPDGTTLLLIGIRRHPDGSEDVRGQLYSRRIDDFDLKPIAGTEGVQRYTFSPDGKSLALIATLSEQSSHRRIMKVPLDGSAPPVAVADFDDNWNPTLTWLNDGDLLVFSATGSKAFRLPASGGPVKGTIAIDTGSVAGSPVGGKPLPGDRGVFFTMETWGPRGYQLDEWLFDPKTGKATRLFENAGGATYLPTGHIVVTRNETLMAAPFDLGKMALTGELTPLAGGIRTPNSWAPGLFDVSDAGTLVYPPGGRVGTDRRLIAVAENGAISPFGGDRRSYETAPALSRDGHRLAAVIPNAQGTYETWIAEQDRTGIRRTLALPNADCAAAKWSFDGQWLAYNRTARDKDDGVYVQRVDGGTPRALLKSDSQDVRFRVSSWTPDGSSLLINKMVAGKLDMLIVPLGTAEAPGKLRVLLSTASSEGDARVSPDGRMVAFSSDESGKIEVYAATFNAGALGQPVMISNGGGGRPLWAADSHRLFYDADPEKVMRATIDVKPGGLSAAPPVVAYDLKKLRINPGEWDVLPDGRIAGIQKGEGEDDITQFNVLLNWIDELRARMEKKLP